MVKRTIQKHHINPTLEHHLNRIFSGSRFRIRTKDSLYQINDHSGYFFSVDKDTKLHELLTISRGEYGYCTRECVGESRDTITHEYFELYMLIKNYIKKLKL